MVELNKDYLPQLNKDIEQLKSVIAIQNQQGELYTNWVDKFSQQIRGRINFVGYVMGKNTPLYHDLYDRFFDATNPPEENFGASSWQFFHYHA